MPPGRCARITPQVIIATGNVWPRRETGSRGAERVNIAREIRQSQHCVLCRRRKEALSPYQVDGSHDVVSDLPEVMVEVIHRVVTDSARLTKNWF